MDPYAPIRPDQEQALRLYLASLGRNTLARVLKQCPELQQPHTLDAGQAEAILGRLRSEPRPPLAIEQPANTTDTRATIAALRDKLGQGYAGRHMQPVGLNKPPGSIR